jgi:hypothetical protein
VQAPPAAEQEEGGRSRPLWHEAVPQNAQRSKTSDPEECVAQAQHIDHFLSKLKHI